MNCDAFVTNNNQFVGCGGILQDAHGDFVFAFSHRLEAYIALEAELWGIYHGVSLAWSLWVFSSTKKNWKRKVDPKKEEKDVRDWFFFFLDKRVIGDKEEKLKNNKIRGSIVN